MLKEFKEFIARGNVLDMAVGVVMGVAFKAIVDSLVADLIMPLIGLIIGDISLADMKYVVEPAFMEAGEIVTPELAFAYGNFIQTIINFLIIAFVIFMIVKGVNKASALRKKKEDTVAETKEEKATDIILLEEIRDLLAKK